MRGGYLGVGGAGVIKQVEAQVTWGEWVYVRVLTVKDEMTGKQMIVMGQVDSGVTGSRKAQVT